MPWGQVFSLMTSMDAPLKDCQENPSCHIARGMPYRVFTCGGEQGARQHPHLASQRWAGKGRWPGPSSSWVSGGLWVCPTGTWPHAIPSPVLEPVLSPKNAVLNPTDHQATLYAQHRPTDPPAETWGCSASRKQVPRIGPGPDRNGRPPSTEERPDSSTPAVFPTPPTRCLTHPRSRSHTCACGLTHTVANTLTRNAS